MPGVEAEGEESLLLIGLSRDLMDCWGRQHKPQGGRLATLGTPGTLARLGTRPGYTTHHGAHGWGLVLTMYWGQHGELIKFREKGTLIDNKSFLSELFAINYRLEIDDKVVTFLQYKQPWLVLCCTELSDSVLLILCTTNTSIIREKDPSDGIQSNWEKSSSRTSADAIRWIRNIFYLCLGNQTVYLSVSGNIYSHLIFR